MGNSLIPSVIGDRVQSVSSATGLVVITLLLAGVLQVIFKLVKIILKRRKDVEMLKAFPGPPPHWLFGNLKDINSPATGLKKNIEWTRKYGDIWPLWLSPQYYFLKTTGPETIQAICNTPEPKDPVGYRFIQGWIGDGLLVSKGRKWARNRRLLTPSFHFDILKPYVDTFSGSADIMVNKWKRLISESGKDSVEVEMFEHVSLMTLDSLMKCIFGITSNIQNEGRRNPYIQSVYVIAELITKRFRFFPHHNDFIYSLSSNGRRFKEACKVAHKFTRDVIDRKRKEKAEGVGSQPEKKYLAFIDMLLDCRDEDGNGLTYQEICDEVDTFMFEGHDTTASGISWCLYNMATHPEYQQKCRDEINEVLGDKENIEWDDLPKLSYLTQCVKESLRLHPPVPNVGRQTTKPLTFADGRTVPEGTFIGIGIYACHHNEKVWPNPEVYDPERFNSENSKSRHPHAFVPFSAGPRNCIGQQFALQEMKTIVAKVIRKFEMSADKSRVPVPVPELILRTKDGLWLNATPL